jgi:Family of unknown function (DUF6272)
MINVYDTYKQFEHNKVMLACHGRVTAESLTSILQIVESQLKSRHEKPAVTKKVYNVLVECLQNAYHHTENRDVADTKEPCSAIFMILDKPNEYSIQIGNNITNETLPALKNQLDYVKSLSPDELKLYYKSVLNNGKMSNKGGGGLGVIDIAIKSNGNFQFQFSPIDTTYSFFSLTINIHK